MKLTAKIVGDVLEATLGYRVEMNPYGFELVTNYLVPGELYSAKKQESARLRCGSGIGGQSAVWGLVRMPRGEPIVMKIDTKAKLVRAVLEFMAGPKPGPLSGYTAPRAKRVIVPRSGASRFVWYRRLKKRPWPQVALVPFGAAHR